MWLYEQVFGWISKLVLGNKPFKEVWKTNKKRAFVVILIFLSVLLNVFLIPKIISISTNYIELSRKYKDTQKELVEARMGCVKKY